MANVTVQIQVGSMSKKPKPKQTPAYYFCDACKATREIGMPCPCNRPKVPASG